MCVMFDILKRYCSSPSSEIAGNEVTTGPMLCFLVCPLASPPFYLLVDNG